MTGSNTDQWDKQLLLHTFGFTSFVFEASLSTTQKQTGAQQEVEGRTDLLWLPLVADRRDSFSFRICQKVKKE